jgi:spore coat protein U-like protein
MTVGAWRSLIGLHVVIPAQPALGLLAGTYSDTMTVTLAAL